MSRFDTRSKPQTINQNYLACETVDRMREGLTLTWVIILLVQILIIYRVCSWVAQVGDRSLRGSGGQAGTWGKYFGVKYFSWRDWIFSGANDMLLFYNLPMWIGEQMLWRIPGSSLSHDLSLCLPKYDWSLIAILRGGAGHVRSRRGYEASRGNRGPRNSRIPREKEFSDLRSYWWVTGERTRITEQFPVNMGRDMNKQMQNINR